MSTPPKPSSAPASEEDRVLVVTLGLFILDTFEWRSSTDSSTLLRRSEHVIGGGGTYTILGSRMWLSPSKIGILVDRGDDWNELGVEEKLREFGEKMWVWRDGMGGETCKALNLYTGEHRDFKYLTPRHRLEPSILPPRLQNPHSLHFICSPSRAKVILSQLPPSTSSNQNKTQSPLIFYEPIPDSCTFSNLEALKEILPQIDIFSPNHEEAYSFFHQTRLSPLEIDKRGRQGIENLARTFLDLGTKDVVVIRSGAWGAYYLSRTRPEEKGWVEAFHAYESKVGEGKVKDVTGAGNSFIGGLMAGLVEGKGLRESVRMGSVSASFTIEQFGLPSMSRDDRSRELWNGVLPDDRLREMGERNR